MKALGIRLDPSNVINLYGMMKHKGKYITRREWIEETNPDADEETKEKLYDKIFLKNVRNVPIDEKHYRYFINSPEAKKMHPRIRRITFGFFEGSLLSFYVEFAKTRDDLVGLIARKLSLPTAGWERRNNWYARLECGRFRVIVHQFTDSPYEDKVINKHEVYIQNKRLLEKKLDRLREKYIELANKEERES